MSMCCSQGQVIPLWEKDIPNSQKSDELEQLEKKYKIVFLKGDVSSSPFKNTILYFFYFLTAFTIASAAFTSCSSLA